MANISSPVPNLVNGVSQQPPSFRLPSQGEVQENCVSRAATGLEKRPPLEHIADLVTAPTNPPFTHFVNRSTDENFVVTIDEGTVSVFDTEGTAQTVVYDEVTDVILARSALPDAAASFVLSDVLQIRLPSGTTSITGITTITAGISGSVVWQRADTADFSGTVTDVLAYNISSQLFGGGFGTRTREHTISWPSNLNGKYLRMRGTRTSAVATVEVVLSAAVKYESLAYFGEASEQRDTLRASTVGDITYVVNSDVTVERSLSGREDRQFKSRSNEVTPDYLEDLAPVRAREYLVYARSLPASSPSPVVDFLVDVGAGDQDVTPSFSSNRVEYAQNFVASGESIQAIDDAALFNRVGEIVHVERQAPPRDPLSIGIGDAPSGEIFAVGTSIQAYSDLPVVAPDGYRVEVLGAPDNNQDNYWVVFRAESSAKPLSSGFWEEAANPFQSNGLKPQTMPHTITLMADGTFHVGRPVWDRRISGDDETNPFPSFLGQNITRVFFHQGRLGFLSESNVVFSEHEFSHNFFRTTVLALLDTAPIDLEITGQGASGGVSPDLLHVSEFNDSLLIFSGTSQHTLSGGDFLSPNSVSVHNSSEFDVSDVSYPVQSGKDLYFVADSGEYSIVREYFQSRQSDSNDAVDITAHIPKYIPKGARKVVPVPSENTLLVLTDGDPGALYVYSFFWQGDEKIQSSWSRWNFEDSTIRDISAVGSELFLLVEYSHSTSLYLEKIDLSSGAEDPYSSGVLYLDRRFTESEATEVTHGTHGGQQVTFITPPYNPDLDASYVLQTRPTGAGSFTPETFKAIGFGIGNEDIIFPGQHEAADFYIGHTYESLFEFSEFSLRIPQPGGAPLPVSSDRVTIKTLAVSYNDTGEYTLEVTQGHTGRTSVYPVFSSGGTGTTSSGIQRALVLSKPTGTRIVCRSTSHRPFKLLSAEYGIEYTPIGGR